MNVMTILQSLLQPGQENSHLTQLVRWTDAYKSEYSLMPAHLDFGPMPFPPMPIPGKYKIG